MNPIEAAVAPLEADAVGRAEKYARARVADFVSKLEAAGWDVNLVAPYPSSNGISKFEYWVKMDDYQVCGEITKWREITAHHGRPCLVDLVPAGVESYVTRIKKQAAEEYQLFVKKLVAKIGDVLAADLDGNHVWSSSTLTVRKADGSVERWFTQQIVNVSCRGKYFNQWPTRKLKR